MNQIKNSSVPILNRFEVLLIQLCKFPEGSFVTISLVKIIAEILWLLCFGQNWPNTIYFPVLLFPYSLSMNMEHNNDNNDANHLIQDFLFLYIL